MEWKNYLLRNFTADDGLPSSSSFIVQKDKNGFIWFGTRDGIAKFDGKIITPFFGKNYPAIQTAAIYSMVEDSEGTLWFSSTIHGLISYKNGEFSTFPQKEKFPTTLSKYLEITSGDSIWVSFYGGLSLVYKDSILTTYTTENGLVYNDIWLLELDSKGALWVATNNGLNIIKKDTILTYTTDNGLSFDVTRSIVELENGEVWVGTDGGGVTIFEDYKPKRILNSKNGLTGDFVQFITQHPVDKSVWLANYNSGIDIVTDEEILNLNEANGLKSNHTMYIFIDDDENIWIASEGGITQLRPRKIELLDLPPPFKHSRITSIYKDSKHDIWIGLNGSGILKEENGRWVHYGTETLNTNGYVDTFLETPEGNMWYGTQGTGIEQLSNGRSQRILNVSNGLSSGYNGDLLYDEQNNLWIATQNGLSVLSPEGEVTTFTTNNGLPSNFIFCLSIDEQNRIWGTTYSSGIFSFEAGNTENIDVTTYTTSNGLIDDRMTTLFTEGDNIWLGSGNGDIQIFNGEEFKTYSLFEDNVNFTIASLYIDQDNFVWISTSIGLIQVKYEDFFTGSDNQIPIKFYTTLDGLPGPSHPLPDNKLIEDEDGNIHVATFNGVGVVPRDEKFRSYQTPDIYFDPISVDGVKADLYSQSIELSPDDLLLEVGISTPAFYSPEKIKIRYRLQGLEDNWRFLEGRSTLYYDYLPDGEYTLTVMASNEMESWKNARTASLFIKVLPPFYKTWWFIGLALLAFGCIIAAIVRVRYNFKMNELNRELAVQQKIKKERERISRDLHDNVGSQITNLITGLEISNLHIKKEETNEALSVINNLDTDARQAMTELRETIWLLNQHKVTMTEFKKHVTNFVKRQKYSLSGLDFSFTNNLKEEDTLQPTQSLHLMRIFQEALNNCRKYAEATEFSIKLQQKNNHITVLIRDNGKGMNTGDCIGKGNGLENMRRRAEEMKGACAIESTPGKGTTITVTFPIIP